MSRPTGKITATEAEELNDAWTNLRKNANDTAAGKPDNRSTWYSIEDMEAFIEMIKNENSGVNGVRCYLGVQKTDQDPQGYTTIFMVPTERNGNTNQDIIGANGMDRGDGGMPPDQGYPN
ncbi:hypothetical protein [uncultured Olleya sp.]|uniref:hypothetical protein n=1 Tax=uncultured Olleya sp. TaxID=757243 RepID=UPI00259135B1|nr:hypothetical protein [uncultured Olleya sp.]